jgi:hydroxymethylpyrimidine kinase / phosphomethylpyrimidine kinase / thiamine-phosphate diphosphorylase
MLVALTIAGSDSIGGAGIEADIKAFASQGVHGAIAITAVTAQNTQRVGAIYPLSTEAVVAQIDAVLDDAHVSAAKTGMLYSREIVTAVAGRLAGKGIPLVVDPVMVAGTGDPLATETLLSALREEIIPIATIVTPNIPEAEALVGYRITDDRAVRQACRDIARLGAEAVLLKGGHMSGTTCVDTFFYNDKYLLAEAPRIEGRGHGGGCILSSYLAANLAKGMGLWEASLAAKASINDAIAYQYAIGKGIPVVEPLGGQLRDGQRYQIAVQLRAAMLEMIDVLPRDWVPEVGTNMVFALPGARDRTEVCALESRIVGFRDRVRSSGCVSFGASQHMAGVALAAMKYDGGMRSAMNLRYSDEHVKALLKAGLSIGSFERGEEPRNYPRDLEHGTEDAIRTLGFVPDVIYDRGAPGKEPMVRLLASSPEELVGKFKKVLV